MDILRYNPVLHQALAAVHGLARLFQFTVMIALIRGFWCSNKQYLSSNYFFFIIILYLADTFNIFFDSIVIVFNLYYMRSIGYYYGIFFSFLHVILVAIMSIERVGTVIKVAILKFHRVICIILMLLAIVSAIIFMILIYIHSNDIFSYTTKRIIFIGTVMLLAIGMFKYWCCTGNIDVPEVKTELKLFWSLFGYVLIQTIAFIIDMFELDM